MSRLCWGMAILTHNTDEDEGREARRGNMEAGKKGSGWGERRDGKGHGRPGGDYQRRE
jgi:hypothetical protein